MLNNIKYPALDTRVLYIYTIGRYSNNYQGNLTKKLKVFNFSLLRIAIEGYAPFKEGHIYRLGIS